MGIQDRIVNIHTRAVQSMSGTGAWQESLMYWQLTQFSVYLLYILHGGLSAVPQKAQVFTDFPTVYARANVQNVDTVLNFQ